MTPDIITTSLQKATGVKDINLEVPENEEHGDFATNIALVLAGKKKNSQKLAREIVEKLKKDRSLSRIVAKIEIAGPGFINFFLSRTVLLDEVVKIIESKDEYGKSNIGEGKTVIIDYSSPNIAKRFGIGHLRSTIIGQVLYNLHKFLGYKVISDNHLGDWGTQFGILLYQIISKKLKPSKLNIDDLEKLYIDFNQEAEDKPKLWDEARDWFKKLEEGSPEAKEIWKIIVDTSMREFNKVYRLLGVDIDNTYGESFYEDKMPAVIAEVRKKGLSKKSKGAEMVEFKNIPPAMLLKRDGATTYFTRDLATIDFRIKTWNPHIFIYEVGAEQILHFKQVFEAAKLLGWDKDRQFVHVAHGLIRFKTGKMSTRRGLTIRLEEILSEAIKRAKKIIEKSETGRGLSEKERQEVAKKVGVGAIKYFDLSHHPTSDIIFDWEKMFVLEGNSAPYLQYTFARTQSLLAKSKKEKELRKRKDLNLNKEELSVMRFLARFPGVIIDAAKNYSPNLLCQYLFNLSQKYNNFYNQHRVIGSRNEEFRLALTAATSQILLNGLGLLGIEAPKRM